MQREIIPSGAVIWFTGLSGSGKTTLAKALAQRLIERGHQVELIDGDEVRQFFPRLGYSREERNHHVQRIAHMAQVLEKHRIISIVALISPFEEGRAFARKIIKNFIEVYVSTPLEICEQRDPKGMYKKARQGEIKHFTGVDDPYEIPQAPELILDTSRLSVDQALNEIEKKVNAIV